MADITGEMHTHDLSNPPGGYGYVYYPCAGLSAIDLREEMYAEREQGGEVETACIVRVDEETGRLLTNNETAEALYVHSTGRIGIAWGADADWADAEGLAEGIRAHCQATFGPPRRESRSRCVGCGGPAEMNASMGPSCPDCYDDLSG